MKTICIYHSRDLDGWMSAAIVKKWFIERLNKPNVKSNDYQINDLSKIDNLEFDRLATHQLDMLGWDYGNDIPDLSEYDEVIMCDISFPAKDMFEIYSSKSFIWIDHHISAIKEVENKFDGFVINGLRDTKFAACELTWMHFFPNESMPEIVRLLGRYDCFGHKNTDEEQKVLEFQYGARQLMSNYADCYSYIKHDANESEYQFLQKQVDVGIILDKGKIIYQYLCTEAKQIYNKAFPIELREYPSKDNIEEGLKKRKFLAVNHCQFNPINFGIDYHKEGYNGFACYHYENGKWCWILYNDNKSVDCSIIAKSLGGGGHAGAAGFVCDTKEMLSLIND